LLASSLCATEPVNRGADAPGGVANELEPTEACS
jgi:hypothetical protein